MPKTKVLGIKTVKIMSRRTEVKGGKKVMLNRGEQLHYRAYKKNVITLQTVLNYSPRLAEYMKSYEKK